MRLKKKWLSVLLALLLTMSIISCNSGDSGSGGDGGGNPPNPPTTTTSVQNTSRLVIQSSNIQQQEGVEENSIKNVTVLLRRGNTLLFDSSKTVGKESWELNRDAAGALVLASKKAEEKLQVNDIITIQASGFSAQQFVYDEGMEKKGKTQIKLKAVEAVQEFILGDLGGGRVSSSLSRGLKATLDESQNLNVQTTDGSLFLSLPATKLQDSGRSLMRRTNASKNSKIYLEMTTIDPKTEGESAIGDYSFDPTAEPKESAFFRSVSRATTAATREESALESVVMANIEMKTESGDRLDCFDSDATFDMQTQQCITSDGRAPSMATLRMKVPTAQFEEFSRKFNLGERRVPLYSYNEATAQWVLQTDKNGTPIDAELILEDNNQDSIANQGDQLYVEGKVSHFSYWNGDYPMQRSCLDGTIESDYDLPVGTRVEVKGESYSGRIFRQRLKPTDRSFSNIYVKKNAKAKIYLRYPDGTTSDPVFVQSGEYKDGNCQSVILPGDEDTAESIVLKSAFVTKTVKVTVTDWDDTPLEKAYVGSKTTNENGTIDILVEKKEMTLSISYNTGKYVTKTTVTIPVEETTVTAKLDTRSFQVTGRMTLRDSDVARAVKGSVNVRGSGFRNYKSTNENGEFTLYMPMSALKEGETLKIDAYAYSKTYSRYLNKHVTITITAEHVQNARLTQNFDFVLVRYHLSGRVTDPMLPDGKIGVAGIKVWTTNSGYTTTDEEGYYNLSLFSSEREETLRAYDNKEREYATPKSITIPANNAENLTDQNFTVHRTPARIKGQVLNTKGLPVQGIKAYWTRGWIANTTDENGQFEVEYSGKYSGKIYLYDQNGRYLTQSNNLTPERGKTSDLGELIINNNIAPIINSAVLEPQTATVGQKVTLTVDAYDPDGDALTYSYLRSGSSFGDSSGDTMEFVPDQSGWFFLQINVDDGFGGQAKSWQSIYVRNNARPQITEITGLQEFYKKSSDMVVTVEAHDREGSPLQYTVQLKNSFGKLVTGKMSVNQNQITISKTVENGDYELVIAVSDGVNETKARRKFRADDNTPPEITGVVNVTNPDATSDVGQILTLLSDNNGVSLQVNVSDEDTASLKYEWRVSEALEPQNGTTSTVTIQPKQSGSFQVGVIVWDNKGLQASKTFNLRIETNRPPIIKSDSGWDHSKLLKTATGFTTLSGSTVTALTLTVNAEDADGEPLSYEFGDIRTNSGTITPTISANQATYSPNGLETGRYAAKFTVKDGTNERSAYAIFSITENRPPRLQLFHIPIQQKVNTTKTLKAVILDPESGDLSVNWKLVGDVSGDVTLQNGKVEKAGSLTTATIELNSGALPRQFNLRLETSDGVNQLTRNRTITIVENQAPTITKAEVFPTTLQQGDTIHLRANAFDQDDELGTVQWILRNTETDATFDIGSKLEANPPIDQPEGNYELYLKVSDSVTATESERFNITITKGNVAPTITDPVATKTSLLQGESAVISVTGSDADQDSISFEWTVMNTIRNEQGDRITFQSNEIGSYTIGVRGFDGKKYSDYKTVTVTVREGALNMATTPSRTQPLGSEFSFTLSFSEQETEIPQDVQWSVTSMPTGSTANITGNGKTAIFTPDKVGSYRVKASVTLHDINYTAETTVSVNENKVEPDLHGVITDESNKPLAGVLVRLYHKQDLSLYDQTTTTDETGSYSFYEVPAGTYYLVIYGGDDYILQTREISIGN